MQKAVGSRLEEKIFKWGGWREGINSLQGLEKNVFVAHTDSAMEYFFENEIQFQLFLNSIRRLVLKNINRFVKKSVSLNSFTQRKCLMMFWLHKLRLGLKVCTSAKGQI